MPSIANKTVIDYIYNNDLPFCLCGCEKRVTIHRDTGIPNKFVSGHNKSFKGHRHSDISRKKISDSLKSEECREKFRLTSQEHWGSDWPMQNFIIQGKQEDSMMRKHGVKHALESLIFQEKYKETSKENWDKEHWLQSEKGKEIFKSGCQKNLNVDWPMQSEEIQKKSYDSWKNHTDQQNKEIIEKRIQTNREKLNCEWPMQNLIIQEKYKQTCLEYFGVDNYAKTFEFRLFARNQMIDLISEGLKDGKKFSPTKGKFYELPFIKELQQHTEFFIDNDSRIIGYFPDGYIKELNLVIEFDEPWHNRSCYQKHDNQKDEDYKHIGLTIFRIKEKNWVENKEKIIQDFKLFLEQRKQELKLNEVLI